MSVKNQKLQKGKKMWLPIIAPVMFKEMIIGETPVYEASEMMGKRLSHNLMNLTNDVKRQNTNVTFEVTEVKDNKGLTSVVAFTMVPSSVKRMVRRRSDRVDLSFACETADGKVVRIKPLLVTRGNTTSVIQRKLYRIAFDYVLRQVKRLTFEGLLNDLISFKFQSEMRARLTKTYPLKSCEIRSLVIADASENVRKVELAPEPAKEAEQPVQEPATQESA